MQVIFWICTGMLEVAPMELTKRQVYRGYYWACTKGGVYQCPAAGQESGSCAGVCLGTGRLAGV